MRIAKLISIADIFTCVNGLLGLFSLLATVSGWYIFALNLILLGVIADGLDGWFARRFSKRWYLGDYLDLMSDTITFCVAPSVLMFKLYFDVGQLPADLGALWGVVTDLNKGPILIPMACGAVVVAGILRLARFCYQSRFPSTMVTEHFIGIPTPSAATTLALLMLLDLDLGPDQVGTIGPKLVGIMAFTLSFLMICDVEFLKLKGNIEWLAGGLLLLAIILPEFPEVVAMVFLSSVIYILGGPLALKHKESRARARAKARAPPRSKKLPKDGSEE